MTITAVPVDATVPHLFAGGELVLLEPGGRVTVEFYISDWDFDTRLQFFQVAVNTTGFESGPIGKLSPAVEGCTSNAECVAAFGGPAKCVNLNGSNVCTPGFQDRSRPDWIFACCNNIAEVSQANPERQIIFGALDLTFGGAAGTLPRHYIGTLVLDASARASGPFRIAASWNPQTTFFFDTEGNSLPIGTVHTADIGVLIPQACCQDGGCVNLRPDECGPVDTMHGALCEDLGGQGSVCDADCNHNHVFDPAELAEGRAKDCNDNGILDECEDGAPDGLLISSVPPANHTLSKSNRNAIELRFACEIERPPLDAIRVVELLPGGAFGPDLLGAGNFSFDVVEDQGVPKLLQFTESGTVSALQNGKWYAVIMPKRWRGMGPLELHFPVLVGDANGDGLTVNRDVLIINSNVGQAVSRFDRRDIDGNGFITNIDVTIANSAAPARMPPKPSGH